MKLFILSTTIALMAFGCLQPEASAKLDPGFVSGSDTSGIILPQDISKLTKIQWLDTAKVVNITNEAPAEIAFRFKNVGTQPLSVNMVYAGCGCTNPQKPGKHIAPGEESYVKAIFDPKKGQIGENMKSITVVTNTEPNTKTLTFVAIVSKK